MEKFKKKKEGYANVNNSIFSVKYSQSEQDTGKKKFNESRRGMRCLAD